MKTITYAVIIRKSGERIEVPFLIGWKVHYIDLLRESLHKEIEKWHGERKTFDTNYKKWHDNWVLDLIYKEK